MKFELGRENDPLIRRIESSVRSGRISHAYLIEGPVCLDKTAFAENFAKGILCPKRSGDHCGRCMICEKIEHDNHEDLIYISHPKSRQTIGIEQIRQMQTQINIKPNGPRYIVVIEESERMTEPAQNCLLKTLEEPPGDAVLMLLAENSQQLLPTIRSRCLKLRIEGSQENRDADMVRLAKQLLDQVLSGSPFYRIRKTMGDVLKDRQRALELIDCMEERCRELALAGDENGVPYRAEDISRCVDALESARVQMDKGMSPGYVVKRMLLSIGG